MTESAEDAEPRPASVEPAEAAPPAGDDGENADLPPPPQAEEQLPPPPPRPEVPSTKADEVSKEKGEELTRSASRPDVDKDKGKEKDVKDKDDKGRDKDRDRKSSRRSRSRSRSRSKDRRSKRSRSRDRKYSRRSRSGSRDRRRSRSRDRKKGSSRRSRSRDRRRSRSKDRKERKERKRSPSDDGVGGYEPRRPREPPTITNGPGTGADPFASMRPQIQQHDPQAQLKLWQQQQLEARAMILEQQAKSAATATSKTQREVYVGGLQPGVVGAEALRTLFNSALSVQFAGYLMPGMDPVINVNLHPAGKYSFVEFRAPEMATAALALHNQVQLLGCTLSVARPSGYVDPTKAVTASQAAKQAVDAFKRGDMAALAAASLAGANLMGLGLPAHIENPALAAAPPILPPGVVVEGVTGLPTTCLCFLGMVTADRLRGDQEYEDMKEDLADQFNALQAGCCLELKVPRPPDPLLADQYVGIGNYGKIFTRMVDADAASSCRERLNGRMYDGQPVQVYFISEEAFSHVQASSVTPAAPAPAEAPEAAL